MKLFDVKSYIEWRAQQLKRPTGNIYQTRRGEFVAVPQFTVQDTVQPDWHLHNRSIEDAEFNLIWDGTITNKLVIDALYENDDELLNNYKSLHICNLANRKMSSRNNVICNTACCLSYWQLINDTFITVSRSLDLRCAGLSDVIIVNRIAHMLGCKQFVFIANCPHIYTNDNKIARRSK